MSWMPATDPVLGDKRSCDALDLVIVLSTIAINLSISASKRSGA